MKQPKSNDLAVVSLILGIISLTVGSVFAGIPAIITGFMSLKNPVNKGMGIAGIIMGGISVVITILFVLFFLLLFVVGAFAASQYEQAPGQLDTTEQFDISDQRSI